MALVRVSASSGALPSEWEARERVREDETRDDGRRVTLTATTHPLATVSDKDTTYYPVHLRERRHRMSCGRRGQKPGRDREWSSALGRSVVGRGAVDVALEVGRRP